MATIQKPTTQQDIMSDDNINAALDTLVHIAILEDTSEALSVLAYYRKQWSREFLIILSEQINNRCQTVFNNPTDCKEKLRGYILSQNEVKDITDNLNSLIDLTPSERHAKIRILKKSNSPSKLKTAIESTGTFEIEKISKMFVEFDRIDKISQEIARLSDRLISEIQLQVRELRLLHGSEDFKLAWESIENIDPQVKKAIILQGIMNGDIPKVNFKQKAKPVTRLEKHVTEVKYFDKIDK